MTDTPHRTVAELRADYEPRAIPLEDLELRSPLAGRVLTDPRPVGAGQRPRVFDRHPAGYDRETLVWERPLDERVRFDIPNGKPRALTLENVVCLFPDGLPTIDTSAELVAETLSDTNPGLESGSEVSPEATSEAESELAVDETHITTRERQ